MQNNRVDSSSDEDYVNEYGCVKDDRFDVLSIDSLYCDLDNINTSLKTLTRSKYCVPHLNIHSLPSKYNQLRSMLSILKDNNVTVHFILFVKPF